MGAVNRVPLGLLGLFDAKVLGRNPAEFSDVVLPTVDILDFYAFSRGYQIFNATTAASGTTGLKAQVNVPQNKLWLVYRISAEVVCAVAGALRFTAEVVDVQAAPTATTIALVSPANLNLAIGEEGVQVPNIHPPLILGRSQGVAVRFVEVDGVGTWAPTIRVMAVEIDA